MLKKFFLVVLFISSVTIAEEPIEMGSKAIEMLKGTVIHVFDDISNKDTKGYNKVAKVRVRQNGTSEIVLLDVPPKDIKINDSIYIAKLDSPETFGLGDNLEYKLQFIDFARDHFAIFIVVPFILLFAVANKKSRREIQLFFINILLLVVVLPLFLKIKIPLFIFLIIFLGINSFFLYYILGSNKYILTLYTVIPVSIFMGIVYKIFNYTARVNEYQMIKDKILLPSYSNFMQLDTLSIIVAGFFIYLFTTILFVRHTFKDNLYVNFSVAAWKVTVLYSLLILGLHLPTINFFIVNGLGFFNLFNYAPFAVSFFKLMFIYWGNILCYACYLTVFYFKNREHFQKNIQIREPQARNQGMDLTAIINQRKETKYNEPLPKIKQKYKKQRRKRLLKRIVATRKKGLKNKKNAKKNKR